MGQFCGKELPELLTSSSNIVTIRFKSDVDKHFHGFGIVYFEDGKDVIITYATSHEKTNSLGFRPGPTQTRLYSHRRWLEAGFFCFGFRK